MSLVYLLIAILVIMAMILLMSKRRALAKYAGYIALVAPVISSIYFLIQIPSVAKLQYLSTSIPWIKTLDINLDLRFRWFKFNVFSYYFTYWNCSILLCNSIFILSKRQFTKVLFLFNVIYVQYDWYCIIRQYDIDVHFLGINECIIIFIDFILV